MSTLVIEGGRRIEGRVDVEGNKNAALPLIAACLLTDEWCTLTNMPRIADVEVMARLLLDLGRGGRRHRQHDAAHPLRQRHQGRARQHAGRPAARLGAAARAAAGAPRPRRRRAAGRRFPGAPHHQDASRSADRDGRARDARLRPSSRGAGRLEAGVDLPRRSVGDGHRDRAARGGGGAGRCRRFATPPASRTSSSSASSCAAWASASPAKARTRSASKASPSRRGATKTLYGDYIEAGSWAVVGAITGGHIDVGGTRPVDMEVVASVLTKMGVQLRAGQRRVPRRGDEAGRRRPHHDRPVARVSRATWSASSRCWPRRPTAPRWCTTGCTSCGCSRSSR